MHLVWTAADRDADEVIEESLRAALGAGEVRSGRLCPVCAGSDHGRPWAEHDGALVPVSLSRAGAHLVVAVAPEARSVGVDVEEGARLERAWPSTVLAPGESAVTGEERLALWVAKEAILKAEGVGLVVPMDERRVAGFDGELTVLDAPPGYAAALALLR